MKAAVLGTGTVGRTLAEGLRKAGTETVIGTRDPDITRANTQKDAMGNPPFSEWSGKHPDVELKTFSEAAAEGELIILALSGKIIIDVIKALPAETVKGKVVWDVSNPLDFSGGMPPKLFICNTGSLGEKVQETLSGSLVVKTLNTITAALMTKPASVSGEHTMFVAGNSADAKQKTIQYLKEWFGWNDIIDLGDISQSRGMEMYLPLWVRTMSALGTPMFGMKIVR